MADGVIEYAIKLRDRLLDVAKELCIRRDGNLELNEMDAKSCDEAAVMLQKLGTEVTRLREGIGLFKYGRLSRDSLVRLPDTWNNDGIVRNGDSV